MISRRTFLTTTAASAAGLSLARDLAFAQQAPAAPPAQAAPTPAAPAAPVTPLFTPIRRNVGFFTGRGGTVAYLVDAKGVGIVDSQFRDTAPLLLAGLNALSRNRPVDRLFNTHHHGDHTDGNVVFKGNAKKVVAHARAAEMMRNPPGQGAPTTEQLYPDATFTNTWGDAVGDEMMRAKYYGPGHTSGDAVITFEKANVAHMGDLMFNRRHPIVDAAAGASLTNWITALESAAKDHANDTIYVFGHANTNQPVTGSRADLMMLRDYITALLAFVGAQVKAGKSKDEILAMRAPLAKFEVFGPFPDANPRDPLTVAYAELTK